MLTETLNKRHTQKNNQRTVWYRYKGERKIDWSVTIGVNKDKGTNCYQSQYRKLGLNNNYLQQLVVKIYNIMQYIWEWGKFNKL